MWQTSLHGYVWLVYNYKRNLTISQNHQRHQKQLPTISFLVRLSRNFTLTSWKSLIWNIYADIPQIPTPHQLALTWAFENVKSYGQRTQILSADSRPQLLSGSAAYFCQVQQNWRRDSQDCDLSLRRIRDHRHNATTIVSLHVRNTKRHVTNSPKLHTWRLARNERRQIESTRAQKQLYSFTRTEVIQLIEVSMTSRMKH